jgi:hypothetical protein
MWTYRTHNDESKQSCSTNQTRFYYVVGPATRTVCVVVCPSIVAQSVRSHVKVMHGTTGDLQPILLAAGCLARMHARTLHAAMPVDEAVRTGDGTCATDLFSIKISCTRYSISSDKKSSSGVYSDIQHLRKTRQAHHTQRLHAHAGRSVAGPTCLVLKKIL